MHPISGFYSYLTCFWIVEHCKNSFQYTKNSRQHERWKIMSDQRSLIQLFSVDAIENKVSLFLTGSLSYLSWHCSEYGLDSI